MANKPELLAPAGSMESLRAALYFGADAVYAGGPMLQLRSAKAGFDEASLREAVKLCHEKGKKLYVTVNSFTKMDELAPLFDYAQFLESVGVDAAIVSDLGALRVMRRAGNLPIHVSTQANCQNSEAAMVYYDLGARRVVLAREMNLNQIAQMREKLPQDMELEAFVHGAMCMAYSGRCLISAHLNGRSGNRGECTQPCRWNWAVMEEKRPGKFFPVEEGENYTAIFSSQDMCCIDILDELAQAGVASFKIEGRMKTAYYVATVVDAYRRRLDGTAPAQALREQLSCISHRAYGTGFYLGYDNPPPAQDMYTSDCAFAASVLGWENGTAHLEQRNFFYNGEALELLSPHSFGQKFTVKNLRTTEGELVEKASHAQMELFCDCDVPLHPGDMLRVRRERKVSS